MSNWSRPNGYWLYNGTRCYPTSGDYEDMIKDLNEQVNWRDVEIDNLHERIRKLEMRLESEDDYDMRLPG